MQKLLVATTSRGKIREYQTLLKDIPFELITPGELSLNLDVAETGVSYEENARIKALAYAEASGLLTLADDSGLEVDALNGEPGLRSSRYAGGGATDRDRINLLLSNLKNVPWEKRTARFYCVIVLTRPHCPLKSCSGECRGIIALEPKGDRGFGYDPVFYFPELNKTIAELSENIKNTISHRGRAAIEAAKILRKLSPIS